MKAINKFMERRKAERRAKNVKMPSGKPTSRR
jgi:hypothetical protein